VGVVESNYRNEVPSFLKVNIWASPADLSR
jgi:hypothetical protein